jgi:trehalose 6-phosphate phosphatase
MVGILGLVAAPTPRSPASAPLLDALAPVRADPARSAVLLDVDGTLAPIVRHADDAHVPEPTRAPLIEIAKRYGVVACVSGRRAAVARRIVSLGSIAYIGNHGSELLRPGARQPELDPDVAAYGRRIQAFAQRAWTDELHRLRVRAEDKDVIAAYHWRGAPDEAAAEAAVRELAEEAERSGFVTHWGRKVLEVRPPVAIDKGRGIQRLLRGADLDAALYVGDDRTDLDAFRVLREAVGAGHLQSAVCIGVRSDETPEEIDREADLLVDGPRGVRDLLLALAEH